MLNLLYYFSYETTDYNMIFGKYHMFSCFSMTIDSYPLWVYINMNTIDGLNIYDYWWMPLMVSNMIIKTYHRRIYTCIYIYTRAYWSVQGLYVLFFYINIPYIYGLNMIQTSHLFHINMLNMGLICFKVVHIKHYKHLKTIMRVCVLIYDQLMHIHWLIWNIDHYNKLHFYWYIYI